MNTVARKQILLVEDDQQICQLLVKFLVSFHYDVDVVSSGQAMKNALASKIFDLVLLDIMLPDSNGFDLCQAIRVESDVPIIIISALEQDSDRILGLEMGADDYLPKPFNTRELLARMKALLRRVEGAVPSKSAGNLIAFNTWQLDRYRHLLIDQNQVGIALSSKEFDLLEIFLLHPYHILSRNQLMEKLYEREFDYFDRSIDVLIGRLRKKIELDFRHPTLLKTVRGAGYQFCAKPIAVKEVTSG